MPDQGGTAASDIGQELSALAGREAGDPISPRLQADPAAQQGE